jgi:hypothetical protein
MVEPSVAGREQVIDAMITLTRLSNMHRAIVAGSESMSLCLSLRRRGFVRIATPAIGSLPRRQHSIALVAGENSLAEIEATLAQVSQFLAANASIAILICSHEGDFCLKIRRKLEQMGVSIEAGVRCQDGLVLSYRQSFHQDFARIEKAA